MGWSRGKVEKSRDESTNANRASDFGAKCSDEEGRNEGIPLVSKQIFLNHMTSWYSRDSNMFISISRNHQISRDER